MAAFVLLTLLWTSRSTTPWPIHIDVAPVPKSSRLLSCSNCILKNSTVLSLIFKWSGIQEKLFIAVSTSLAQKFLWSHWNEQLMQRTFIPFLRWSWSWISGNWPRDWMTSPIACRDLLLANTEQQELHQEQFNLEMNKRRPSWACGQSY